MSSIQVKVGDTFRSVIADCNALWKVTRIDAETCHCVVVNEPWEHAGNTYDSDFAGRRQPFYMAEVRQRIAQAQAWERIGQENDAYFDGLEPGAIVHYNNGFAQFVRCEVIVPDEDYTGPLEKYPAGTKLLQPIALVGAWKPHELPRTITELGETRVLIPYHADKVLNRTGAWRPSAGCVYESPSYSSTYSKHGDPTDLPAIDLNVEVPA